MLVDIWQVARYPGDQLQVFEFRFLSTLIRYQVNIMFLSNVLRSNELALMGNIRLKFDKKFYFWYIAYSVAYSFKDFQPTTT